MIITRKIKIKALSGNLERNLYIYLPTTYDKTNKRYPVLYMFDGHNIFQDEEATFGRGWRIHEYLDYTDTEVIIVGLECNKFGNNRLSEYSPVDFIFKENELIKGMGKKTMDYITKTLKPQIDKEFRTIRNKDNTCLVGSSMGGLMSLFGACSYQNVFGKIGSFSPSLWIEGKEEVLEFIKEATFPSKLKIFMSYGSNEFQNHESQKKNFAATCACLIEKNAQLNCQIIENGYHNEATWGSIFPVLLRFFGYLPLKEKES